MLSRIAGFGEFQRGRFSDRSRSIPQSGRLIPLSEARCVASPAAGSLGTFAKPD
jgi:hypothetical protein